MNNNFNNPDFDSRRFDPLKPKKFKSGEEFARHQRIVSAALKEGGWDKQVDPSDVDRLVAQATNQFKEVENIIKAKFIEGIARGTGTNRLEAIELAQGEFLHRFAGYSRDELIILLTTFLTRSVVDRQT